MISLAFWKGTEILCIKDQASAKMKLFCAKIWVTSCSSFEKIHLKKDKKKKKKKMEKMVLLLFSGFDCNGVF